MGKDDDKGVSKEELKDEHIRLVAREKELSEQYQNIKAIFMTLEEAYQTSKGSFSVQRYGQLKDMIKGATSPETLNNFKKVIDGSSAAGGGSGKSGLVGLMAKAKEFSGGAQEQSSSETASSTKPGKSSGSSFMKKLKNITGFSSEPIADEDVMTKSELQRDNARKQRAIQHLIGQLSHAVNRLEKLRHNYEASKSHAPPKRYTDLKEMIKTTVADKLP